MHSSLCDIGRGLARLRHRFHLTAEHCINDKGGYECENCRKEIGCRRDILSGQKKRSEHDQRNRKDGNKPENLLEFGNRKIAGHLAGLTVHGE